MKILIYGASGATGHELVNQALMQGHFVTAFVRNPQKLKIRHDNLTIIQGDILNYQLVENAVKGQHAVLSALGAASPFKYDQSIVDGVNNIIKAMEANSISRFLNKKALIPLIQYPQKPTLALLVTGLNPRILYRSETFRTSVM